MLTKSKRRVIRGRCNAASVVPGALLSVVGPWVVAVDGSTDKTDGSKEGVKERARETE